MKPLNVTTFSPHNLLTSVNVNKEEITLHGNTKLAIMPILLTLCVCEKLEYVDHCNNVGEIIMQ